MEVAEGGQAGVAYERLVSGTLSAEERNRTIKTLQAYCGQDTRAMAEVYAYSGRKHRRSGWT